MPICCRGIKQPRCSFGGDDKRSFHLFSKAKKSIPASRYCFYFERGLELGRSMHIMMHQFCSALVVCVWCRFPAASILEVNRTNSLSLAFRGQEKESAWCCLVFGCCRVGEMLRSVFTQNCWVDSFEIGHDDMLLEAVGTHPWFYFF